MLELTTKKPRVLEEDAGFLTESVSESGGTRTLDPRIKSPLLYRLSYALLLGFSTVGKTVNRVFGSQDRFKIEPKVYQKIEIFVGGPSSKIPGKPRAGGFAV